MLCLLIIFVELVVTCEEDGCECLNYNSHLMQASDMRQDGKCINCMHAIGRHPQKPISGKDLFPLVLSHFSSQ